MGESPATSIRVNDGPSLEFIPGDGASLVAHLRAGWETIDPVQCRKQLKEALTNSEKSTTLVFKESGNESDRSLAVAIILECIWTAEKAGLKSETTGLPDSLRRLVDLAIAVKPHHQKGTQPEIFIRQVGRQSVQVAHESFEFIRFLGELGYSLARLLMGKARFRSRDFWVTIQECGVSALPIVALISVLTGTILGFVGAVQLEKFGATIYMTDLVGLAMAREMASIMTGVIMSGRTGAAFAAQIGSMNVNQEVDALKTFSLRPMEFLVLPRALALIMMMPLLTLFANVLGWLGGFFVAIPMNINASEYWLQLTGSLTLTHIGFGLFKSFFFGAVVASSGCYYGLKSGRSSAAVGEAATKAVVTSITWIIILDALFAFLIEMLGW